MLVYFLIILFIYLLVVGAVLFCGLLVAAITYFFKLGHNNHGLHIYYSDHGHPKGHRNNGLLWAVETMGPLWAVASMGLVRAI